jgi:lipopolysaccharide biosynthesis glycosyltransferase
MKLITFATEDYLIGTRALLASLIANAKLGDFDFTVMTDGPVKESSKASILKLKENTVFIDRRSITEVHLGSGQSIKKQSWRLALQKLAVFDLPPDGVRLYIDSDMICVGPLQEAASWTHLTAPVVFGITLPKSINGRPMFSSGLFAFESSSELFGALQAHILTMADISFGDQQVLNEYFSANRADDVHLVGIEWEMLRRIYRHHPQVWNAVGSNKRMVHYVGRKPWQQPPEPGYEELTKLWKKYAQ